MPSINEKRFQTAWDELLAMERDHSNNVTGNPVAIASTHFRGKYELSQGSAYQLATKFVAKLVEDDHIIPCLGCGRGRNGGAISSFEIKKAEPLIFPKEKVVEKENGRHHLNGNDNLCQELASVKSGVFEIIGLLKAGQQKASAKKQKVAIWVDGPNLTHCSNDAGVEVPLGHLIDQAKRYGDLVSQFVFQNTGVPDNIVREFEVKGYTNIVCTRPKATFTQGYDPVDVKMAALIREMVGIADVHFVVTEDKDAEPIIVFVRQQTGKLAIRAFVRHPEGALIVDEGDMEQSKWITLRKLGFSRQ